VPAHPITKQPGHSFVFAHQSQETSLSATQSPRSFVSEAALVASRIRHARGSSRLSARHHVLQKTWNCAPASEYSMTNHSILLLISHTVAFSSLLSLQKKTSCRYSSILHLRTVFYSQLLFCKNADSVLRGNTSKRGTRASPENPDRQQLRLHTESLHFLQSIPLYHGGSKSVCDCCSLFTQSSLFFPLFSSNYPEVISVNMTTNLTHRNRTITLFVALATLSSNILSSILFHNLPDDPFHLARNFGGYLHFANLLSIFGLVGALRVCLLFS